MNSTNPSNLIEIFGLAATVVNDLVVLISVFGSSMLVLTSIIGLIRRKRLRFGERELQWSLAGLVIGVGGQICIALSKTPVTQIGVVVRMTPQTANLLLGLSFALFLLAFFLRRQIERASRIP